MVMHHLKHENMLINVWMRSLMDEWMVIRFIQPSLYLSDPSYHPFIHHIY